MPLLSFRCEHRFPGGFQLAASFDVDHRFTALFGPSGSGKTSVLNMIAGFLRPQTGTIRLAGRTLLDTAQGRSLPSEKRHVGMVFQDSVLFPHLTVEGNLRYGERRRPRETRRLEFTRVADVLGIGRLLKRFPRSLSGGERQRVALGRALLSGAEMLLMDEPLASLDTTLKDRVLAYLERVVAEWDIPAIFVTHAQAEVRRAAGWVVLLENGRVIGSGGPEEALSRPEPLGWRNAAGPVNLLRLEDVASGDGGLTARIGDQLLTLPPWEGTGHLPSFVEFSPTDVVLSRQDVSGLSARNHLHGCVRKLILLRHAVFAAIDIGQILWAEVTPQAAAELGLQPGVNVTCFLKAHSLHPWADP